MRYGGGQVSRYVQCSVTRAVQGNTWGSAGTQRGYLLQESGKKAAGQRFAEEVPPKVS